MSECLFGPAGAGRETSRIANPSWQTLKKVSILVRRITLTPI
jgi:hypothetical protein